MDFARKQLEKYGWADGKGLGKHENGISEALKPKLKRSVTGIGHDPASEFNEHWWTALYNKAAGNIEVKEKNNKTKKIKANTSDFEITNSTWKLKNDKKQSKEKYSDSFVRTAVLNNGGSKMEIVREVEDQESGNEKKDVFQMTDEELFKACEGRTAHKGARHGLKALGKLARIAQQEEMLLSQPQYKGYSHSKNTEEVVENLTLDTEKEIKRKKKKKKNRCFSDNDTSEHILPIDNSAASVQNEIEVNRKSKKSKLSVASIEQDIEGNSKEHESNVKINMETEDIDKPKKKKQKIQANVNGEIDEFVETNLFVKKKKKIEYGN